MKANIGNKKNYFRTLKKNTATFAQFGINYDDENKLFTYKINNTEVGFSPPPNDMLSNLQKLEKVKNDNNKISILNQLMQETRLSN